MHFDLLYSVAATGLTSSSLNIETEPARLISAHFGFGQMTEDIPDVAKEACVSRWVRSWGSSNWGLIDLNDFVNMPGTDDFFVAARFFL